MEQQKMRITDMELGEELSPEVNRMRKTARDYWEQFSRTGSVMDYLNYKASFREEQSPWDIK